MKALLLSAIIIMISLSVSADAKAKSIICTVTSGAYAPPFSTEVMDAEYIDKSIIGTDFNINLDEGQIRQIKGGGLFNNTNYNIQIIENTDNKYVLLSQNKHKDILHLVVSFGYVNDIRFRSFHSWIGLMLVGECKN